ncbi:SRPBCC family protein [Pyxidicoccus sp. 3LFB2]
MDARRSSEPVVRNLTTMALEGEREIVITRTFNAPPRIVFQAWTQPELVKRWWAPKSLGVSVVSCEADVREGGTYRYVLKPEGADAFAFSGRYTEVSPHSRLVYTQAFEPMAGAGEAVIHVTFEERDGKTRLVSREQYPSKEARDGALASGMEQGMRETLDQLDALVPTLR